MPQSKYLKQDGEVIYPITTAENVLNSAGLGCFDWCNGIIWCFATRSSAGAWTIRKSFGSHGISVASMADTSTNGRFQINFSGALPHTYYGAWVSGEVGGTGVEIIGVFGRTTTYFHTDFSKHDGTAQNPTEVSVLVIY